MAQASTTFASVQFVKQPKGNGVEMRLDPLTGMETRNNPARATRPKQGEADSNFMEVVKSSQARQAHCL